MYKIISIEGNLSSGKHLFLSKLRKKYKDDNNCIIIDDINIDDELTFSNKLKQLLDKYNLIKELTELNGVDKTYIINRTLDSECNVYTKLLYEQGRITEDEWNTYNRVYNLFDNKYEPTSIIYVDRDIDGCLKYNDKQTLVDLQHCDALYQEYLYDKQVAYVNEYFKKKSK